MARHDVAEPGDGVEGMLSLDILVGSLLRKLEREVRQQVVGLRAGLGVGIVADRLFEQFLALGDLAAGEALLAELAVPLGQFEPGLRHRELRLHGDRGIVEPLGKRHEPAVAPLEDLHRPLDGFARRRLVADLHCLAVGDRQPTVGRRRGVGRDRGFVVAVGEPDHSLEDTRVAERLGELQLQFTAARSGQPHGRRVFVVRHVERRMDEPHVQAVAHERPHNRILVTVVHDVEEDVGGELHRLDDPPFASVLGRGAVADVDRVVAPHLEQRGIPLGLLFFHLRERLVRHRAEFLAHEKPEAALGERIDREPIAADHHVAHAEGRRAS